jgi:pimeloyl-ACP methyl ester carboxylesterase
MSTSRREPAPPLAHEEQGHGHSVVFIHGYISDRRVWSKARARWNDPGRLFFPTLRGFGNSASAPDPAEFGTEPHLRQLAGFLEDAAGEPAHLVGWSYGATIALLLASLRPDLVASVYSYEAGLSSFVTDQDIAHRIAADRSQMAGPAIAAVGDGDPGLAVERIVDGSCGRDGVFAGLDASTRRVFCDNAGTVRLMFASLGPPRSGGIVARLEDIRCPVTLSTGEHARPAYGLVADEAMKAIPGACREVIPHALHVAPVTDPAAFITSVMTHLGATAQKGLSY